MNEMCAIVITIVFFFLSPQVGRPATLHSAGGGRGGADERYLWQRAAAGGDVATATEVRSAQRLHRQPGHGGPGGRLLRPAAFPAGPAAGLAPRRRLVALQVGDGADGTDCVTYTTDCLQVGDGADSTNRVTYMTQVGDGADSTNRVTYTTDCLQVGDGADSTNRVTYTTDCLQGGDGADSTNLYD